MAIEINNMAKSNIEERSREICGSGMRYLGDGTFDKYLSNLHGLVYQKGQILDYKKPLILQLIWEVDTYLFNTPISFSCSFLPSVAAHSNLINLV